MGGAYLFLFFKAESASWLSVKNGVKVSEVKRGQYPEIKSHHRQIISESWPLGGGDKKIFHYLLQVCVWLRKVKCVLILRTEGIQSEMLWFLFMKRL